MSKTLSFIGLLVLALCIQGAFAQGVIETWVVDYNGVDDRYDEGRSVAVDSAGNVYVTGYSRTVSTGDDVITIKYDADGNEVWVVPYNRLINNDDSGYAVALDGSGNLYVAGRAEDASGTSDMMLLQYDTDGNLQWARFFDGAGNSWDSAVALAVGPFDDVHIVGYASNVAGNYDFSVVTYNTAGTELWSGIYDGAGNGRDQASYIAVDSSGNVYISGVATNAAGNYDFAVIKYNSSGVQQWVGLYDEPGAADTCTDVGVDQLGNVFLSGYTQIGTGSYYKFTTVKFNSSGTQQWVRNLYGATSGYNMGTNLEVDKDGDVFVVGRYKNATFNSLTAVIKYDTDGNQLWFEQYDLSTTANPRETTLDADGNLYIVGEQTGNGYDFMALKYDTDGNRKWAVTYDGSSSDYGRGIAVDPDGNVYVAGFSYLSSDFDYLTIKYAPDEQTPIELISFEAEALEDAVLLSWETATEKDNAGFNLYRSDSANGSYERITSSMLPAEGNEFTGASYEFTDGDVEAGNTYYYKLEDVSIYGVSTFHGPVEVTLENEPQFGCGQ